LSHYNFDIERSKFKVNFDKIPTSFFSALSRAKAIMGAAETPHRTLKVIPGPELHCRVLPPGEYNRMILEPLPVYSESFTTMAATVSRNVAMVLNIV